jgi:hypothetical protein
MALRTLLQKINGKKSIVIWKSPQNYFRMVIKMQAAWAVLSNDITFST